MKEQLNIILQRLYAMQHKASDRPMLLSRLYNATGRLEWIRVWIPKEPLDSHSKTILALRLRAEELEMKDTIMMSALPNLPEDVFTANFNELHMSCWDIRADLSRLVDELTQGALHDH